MTANVTIENISKTFGYVKALQSVSMTLEAGEFVVLLGPSGCGKSTLLSIIGGFTEPTSGQVLVGDRCMALVPPAKRPTTTVFQDYALFPHMSLCDNVAFGLRMRGQGRAERKKVAEEFLKMVGLEDASTRKPHEISGGQRQRVALARALAVSPEVLLLDEPLGALDLRLRHQMQAELKSIQKNIGTTFIHVTHDQEEAMAIADKIVVMNEGRIEDIGTPLDIYMRPKSLFSASFMGEMNLISAVVNVVSAVDVEVESAFGKIVFPMDVFTAGKPEIGQKVKICIRPEQLKTIGAKSSARSLGKARIVDRTFFGTYVRCNLISDNVSGKSFIIYLPQSSTLAVDADVEIKFNAAQSVVLPADLS